MRPQSNDDIDKWTKLFDEIESASNDPRFNRLEFVNDPMVSLSTNESQIEPENTSSMTCAECNIQYLIKENLLICPRCGSEQESLDIDTLYGLMNNDHNTSNNAFLSFKIIGKNSYCLQKSFLKCCANNSTYRNNSSRSDIYNSIYQSKGNKLPKDVMSDACDMYQKIRESGKIYRGNGKKGIIAACLYYSCIMKNITKTPREISSILNVEEKVLSRGDRKLQELNENSIVNIPTMLRPIEDYIFQYFSALCIDTIYMPFVIDLVKMAEKKKIAICMDSRTTSKCIGAIYMLTMRIRSLKHITRDHIAKECKISKATFIRYYRILDQNHDKIKHVFKKYKIPMPTAWRK